MKSKGGGSNTLYTKAGGDVMVWKGGGLRGRSPSREMGVEAEGQAEWG